MSDYCLASNEQFVSYIMGRTTYILMRWWWRCPFCTRPIRWDAFYGARSLEQQTVGRHVTPLLLIILIPSKCLFLLHSATCLAGKQQISFLKQNLVWPTQPELVLTIDRARGENANNYNTDTVDFQKCYLTKISLIASFYERLALTDTIKWISKISHWNNSKIQPKNLKNGGTPNTYTWLLTFLTCTGTSIRKSGVAGPTPPMLFPCE